MSCSRSFIAARHLSLVLSLFSSVCRDCISPIFLSKESDKICILAVNKSDRAAQLPNAPTISEFYPGFSLPAWNGLLAPVRTPKPILAILAKETHDAAQDPTIARRLRELGIEPGTAVADELGEIIRGEQTIFQNAVKTAGLTKG